jgi:hypothetical protein
MTFTFTDDGRAQVVDAFVPLDAEDFDFTDTGLSTWFHAEGEQFDNDRSRTTNSRNSDFYRG